MIRQGMIGGAMSPGATMGLMTAGAVSSAKMLSGALQESTNAALRSIGGALGSVGVPLLGAAGALGAAGVNYAFSRVQSAAQLERPRELGRATGGVSTGLGSAAVNAGIRRGYRPAEAAGLASQVLAATGVAGSGSAFDFDEVFRAAASGISPQLMGRLAGAGGAGGGATEGVRGVLGAMRSLLVQGQNDGLRGRRLDEMLARLSSAATMFAEQGMRLSMGSVAVATQTLRSADQNAFGGMFGVQSAIKLSQTGMQGARQIGGMFSGLAESALLADAFAGASDPLEAMARAEATAGDPLAVQRAIRGQLGDAAGYGFAGAGFSARQSRVLARQLDPVAPATGTVGREGTFKVSAKLARQDADTMSAALNANVDELIGAMTALQKMLINAGGKAAVLVDGVNRLLAQLGRLLDVL